MKFVKINEQFEIGKYPVTIKEWVDYCNTADKPIKKEILEKLSSKSNHPVVYVNWYEAKEFCSYYGYELPTEEQWYLAAAGKEKRLYPWGNIFDSSYCNTCESGNKDTTPVDFYPQGATPEGVYDLAGNIFEWCENKYKSDYRALRGGSWADNSVNAACACQSHDFPDYHYNFIGFRCIRKK